MKRGLNVGSDQVRTHSMREYCEIVTSDIYYACAVPQPRIYKSLEPWLHTSVSSRIATD